MQHPPHVELRAAYERIEELVTLLRRARPVVARAGEGAEVVEIVNDIDDALLDGVVQ